MSDYIKVKQALKSINLDREKKKITRVYESKEYDLNNIYYDNNYIGNIIRDQYQMIEDSDSSDLDDECLRMKKQNNPNNNKKYNIQYTTQTQLEYPNYINNFNNINQSYSIHLEDYLKIKSSNKLKKMNIQKNNYQYPINKQIEKHIEEEVTNLKNKIKEEIENNIENNIKNNIENNIENKVQDFNQDGTNNTESILINTKQSQQSQPQQVSNQTNINLDNLVEFTFKSGGYKYDFSGSFLSQLNLCKKDFQNNLISKYSGNVKLQGKILVQKDRGEKKYYKYLEEESYQDYLNKIRSRDSNSKYIARDKWIYDIIDGKSEQDRIIYRDEFFLIVSNSDWDEKNHSSSNIEKIHLMAIPTDKSLRSLRSLTGEHIELLKYIKEQSLDIIKNHYKVDLNILKIYLHYSPSVYHLHIHFVNTNNTDGNCQTLHEYSHDLDTIIFNLTIKSDYYQTIKLRLRTNGEQI